MEKERVFFDQLPEIYQDDGLLRELVGVFEELYLELEGQIDDLPGLLYDPQRTPERFLNFVGALVGLQNEQGLLSPAQMRALLPLARELQARKGTRPALETLLNTVLSVLDGGCPPPLVVEYDDWNRQNPGERAAERYTRLFGGESDFTVLLPGIPALAQPGEEERLTRLVQEYSPAFSKARVVTLKNETRPGGFCVLGRNTYI